MNSTEYTRHLHDSGRPSSIPSTDAVSRLFPDLAARYLMPQSDKYDISVNKSRNFDNVNSAIDVMTRMVMDNIPVKIALTNRAKELGIQIQEPAKFGDVGIDVQAIIEDGELTIPPHTPPKFYGGIPTGLIIEMPLLHGPFLVQAEVKSRTGVAMKLALMQGPQVVDPGYRPDRESPDGLVIGMINHGNKPVTIEHGQKVAQLVFGLSLNPAYFKHVNPEDINYDTERGSGRFGSTGW